MSNNKFIAFILFMIVSASSHAQKYYSEGYIILLSGDTLYGSIKDASQSSMKTVKPISIWFQDKNGIEKRYRADILRGYCRLGTLNYISISDLDEGPFFARVIIQGNLTLLASSYDEHFFGSNYSGIDNKLLKDAIWGSRFFLLHVNKEFTHEISKPYFKADMSNYFSDCTELQQMILNNELKYADIEIIVKKYNEWFAKK